MERTNKQNDPLVFFLSDDGVEVDEIAALDMFFLQFPAVLPHYKFLLKRFGSFSPSLGKPVLWIWIRIRLSGSGLDPDSMESLDPNRGMQK